MEHNTKNSYISHTIRIFRIMPGFLLLVLFLFYPFSASAQWYMSIVRAFLWIPYSIIALVFVLFIMITQAFAWLTGYILDVVMSPSFLSLSYANPATNPIIRSGLIITQSFVNLLLVLGLVYTALSIALRINERGAQQMLVRLIIVALLVNFAPVFCGLVVDGANIAMYYFLKPMEEGVSGVLTQIGSSVGLVISSIKKVTADLPERLGVLMMASTQIAVNVAMGFAFLLFAAIFLFRYIAIWVLVILAPLAFAGWVFPKAKPPGYWEFLDWILFPLRMLAGFWDMWLKQFIEWTIIGIPMAFFLYLAMGSFTLMTAAFKQKITMPGIEPAASGFFNEVFPYVVVIAFLYLGFTMGLQTGAMGAGRIVAAAKAAHWTAQKRTFKGLGKTVGRAARATGRALKAPIAAIPTFMWQKRAGYTTFQALKHTAGAMLPVATYWAKAKGAAKTAVTPKAWGPAIKARWGPAAIKARWTAKKGILSAVGNVYRAGKAAALKGKTPEAKAEKKVVCPSCGETVPDRKFCANCRAQLIT